MLVFLLCLLVLSVGMTAAAKETLNQTNRTSLKGVAASLKVRGTKEKVRFRVRSVLWRLLMRKER